MGFRDTPDLIRLLGVYCLSPVDFGIYQSRMKSIGMITIGESFVFLKLLQGNSPQYARSQEFITLNPGNELYQALRILKHLSQITINNANSN